MYYSILHRCFLLIALFSFATAQAQFPRIFKKKNQVEAAQKVLKTEKRWQYKIQNNQADTTAYLAAEAQYKSNGHPIQLTTYRADGTTKHHYQFKEDPNAKKRTRYWEHEEQEIKDYVEEMDALGNVIKLIRYKPNGEILDITMRKFDSNGRCEEEVYYDDANKRVYEIKRIYNIPQRSVTEHYHDFDTGEKYMTAIKLDNEEAPLSKTRYKKSGPLVDKEVYIRDEKGRITEKQIYPDGKTMKIKEVYEYRDDENKMDCTVYKGAQLIEKYTYEYYFY